MLAQLFGYLSLLITTAGRAIARRVADLHGGLASLSDAELVEETRARGPGDDRPFRELWHRHQRMIWRTCYSFMRNGNDAEDLVQEVFLKAYRNLDSFEGRAQFKTWLNRIAINAAKNELRRRSRRPQVSDTAIEEMAEWFPTPSSPSVESQVASLGNAERLALALRELSSEEYEVLHLREFEERSYREIAEILGIGLSATKMRVQRARLTLQRLYLSQLDGERIE